MHLKFPIKQSTELTRNQLSKAKQTSNQAINRIQMELTNLGWKNLIKQSTKQSNEPYPKNEKKIIPNKESFE